MKITNPKVEKYMTDLLKNRASIYIEVEDYAASIDFPIIEPLVGVLLNQYSKLIQAKRILELGSGFGYSALWFSEKMDSTTAIVCTDFMEENKQLAEKYFKKAGVKTKIDFRIGDAIKILDEI